MAGHSTGVKVSGGSREDSDKVKVGSVTVGRAWKSRVNAWSKTRTCEAGKF